MISQEAENAERSTPAPHVFTCRAIVRAVHNMGVDAADLEPTLVADAEEAAKRGGRCPKSLEAVAVVAAAAEALVAAAVVLVVLVVAWCWWWFPSAQQRPPARRGWGVYQQVAEPWCY